MNTTNTVLLEALSCIIVFFSIIIVLIRLRSSKWLDLSLLVLLFSLAFFFMSDLLEWTMVSNVLEPYEDFFLPLVWSFCFYSMFRTIQLNNLEQTHNELKISEHRITRQNEVLAGILEILDKTLTVANEEELGQICLSVAEKITRSEIGFIGEIDDQSGKLEFTAISELAWEACKVPDKSGHHLGDLEELAIYDYLEKVIINKDGFFSNTSPPLMFPNDMSVGHPELRCFLGVPLILSGRVIGMIGLANNPSGYTTHDLESMQALAPSVAKAFTSKRSENELRESEENARTFFENLAVGTAQINTKGKFIKVNDRFCNITGYSSEELCGGMSPLDIDIPEERAIDEERINHFFKDKVPYDVEKRYLRKDGTIVWVHVTVASVCDTKRDIIFTAAIIEDITERKRAEKSLRESEERMRLFIEHSPASLAMFDLNMHYIAVSRRWITDYNFGKQDIIGKSHYQLFPEIPDRWKEIHRRGMRGEVIVAQNDKFVRANGKVQWVSWEVRPWYSTEGSVGGIVIFTEDITERKQAEIALAQKEEHLRTILNSLADAVIATDTSGIVTRINPTAEYLTGWRGGQALGKPLNEILAIVNSDTGETVPDPVFRVLQTSTIVNLADHTKLISRDGHTYQIADSSAPIRDAQGTITGVALVFRDVTEEYGIREALRESEERYRLFYDTSPFALLAVKNFSLSNPNPSASKLFGISAEELVNTPPWELSPERQPDGSLSHEKAIYYIREALAGRPQYFEWRHQRKDGTQFDAEVALTRVFIKGEPQITATVLDITDRKNALEKLKTSLHEKETLLQEIYHRTKNNMMVISSFLELQAASVDNEEVDRIIHDSVSRIRTMSLAHEMLYKGKSLSRINMQDYITGLAHLLEVGCGISQEQVELKFDIKGVEMLIDIAIPCGLIINELLSNCYKYAFPHGKKGSITIGLKRSDEKQIELKIQDNGVGLPTGFNIMQSNTLGIQLVFQIAHHQLHAKIHMESKQGLCWCIAFSEDLYSERIQP
jgi:PAS domain S-box-containing protein